MTYLTKLASPMGPLSLASDGDSILGLWLEGQKYFAAGLEAETEERPDLPVFLQAAAWLDAYFEKRDLPPLPPLASQGKRVPEEGVEAAAGNSPWRDCYLWRLDREVKSLRHPRLSSGGGRRCGA